MKTKDLLGIIAAGIWVSLSEFFRNEFLLKEFWTEHYASLGLSFPSAPINGLIWGIWSLAFAFLIYLMLKKFNLIQSIMIAWLAGFVLMWLVTGNMLVLPFGILFYAIPLSILETAVAAVLIKRLSSPKG